MKLSSNSIGMLIFTALATAVFALMILRPAVEGNAMNLGMPINADSAMTETAVKEEMVEKVEEAVTENMAPAADTATTENTTEEATTENSMTSEEAPSTDSSTEASPAN